MLELLRLTRVGLRWGTMVERGRRLLLVSTGKLVLEMLGLTRVGLRWGTIVERGRPLLLVVVV